MKRITSIICLLLTTASIMGQHPGLVPTRISWDTSGAAGVQNISIMNPGSVPADIDRFVNLRQLSLYGNDWDYELRSLPKELCSLKKLRSLSILNTNIDALPAGIWSIPSLEILSVSSNKICALPGLTGSAPPLKVLNISQELDSIPTLPSLEKITYWVYQPKNGYRFAGLGKNQNLKQVAVYGTGTNDILLDALLAQTSLIQGLRSLDLGDMIPSESHLNTISTFPNLKTLRFSVLSSSPEALAYFTKLDTLEIRSIAATDIKIRQQVFEELFSMGLNDLILDFRPDDIAYLKLMPNLSLNITDEKHIWAQNMDLLASLDGLKNISLPDTKWLPDSITKLVRLRHLDMSHVVPDESTLPLAEHVFVLISKIPLLASVRIHWTWLQEKPERISRISHLKEVVVVGCPEINDPNSPEMQFRKEVIKHCSSVTFQPF